MAKKKHNPNIIDKSKRRWWLVKNTRWEPQLAEVAPLRDYMMHGYETRKEFVDALGHLVERWGERIGEQIDERNGFVKLRFHDTPGGYTDEAWLPLYLIDETEIPEYIVDMEREPDPIEQELDHAFGIDFDPVY